MDELLELRQENKKFRHQISLLETELQQYQASGAIGHYYEMNRWVNSVNAYVKVKAVNIGELVTTESKDFERMMALIKSTREIIESLSSLKSLLGITENEEKDKEYGFVEGKDFISNVAMKRV